MLKIFKTVIRPNEGTEVYQRDSKHRVTMGYNAGTISVKVEEIIAPNPNLDESLPENTPTVLRDVHEISNYVTVAEKTFTESSFIKTTDNNKWIVEYDSNTKTISAPIDVYEISKQYIDGSNSHEKIYYNLNKYRYENDASRTPLFVVDSFFKEAGFEASTLQFFVEELQVSILDTILEVTNEEVTEVTPREYEFWCNYNLRTAVTFEVLDEDGKILSSAFQSVKPTSKSSNFIALTQKSPVDLSNVSESLGVQQTGSINGNRFYAKLPATDKHTIRILFGNRAHNLTETRYPVTFDIECVNGVSNKSRVVSLYDVENPNIYIQDFINSHNHPAEKMETAFAGADGIVVITTGLVTGDFFKVKLNLGEFTSWAELWIDIE